MSVVRSHANYYEILEVGLSADGGEISASYRRLARLRHPDKNPDNPNATADFQKLQEAYSTLADSQRRLQYDRQNSKPAPLGTRTKDPTSRNKQGRYTVNTFHVDPYWTGGRTGHAENSWANGSQTSQQSSSMPTRDNVLDKQIREARQQIFQDQQLLAEYKQRQTQTSQKMDSVWTKIELMNATLRQTKATQNEAPETVNSRDWLGGYFGPTETPKKGPCEAQTRLLHNITKAQEDLNAMVNQARSTMVEMKNIEARKVEREEALHKLCLAWREKEFKCENAPGPNNGDGWDGWCGWDDDTQPDFDADQPQPTRWWDRDEDIQWLDPEDRWTPYTSGSDFGPDERWEAADEAVPSKEGGLGDGESSGVNAQRNSVRKGEIRSPVSVTMSLSDELDAELIDLGLDGLPQVKAAQNSRIPTVEKDEHDHLGEQWGLDEHIWDQKEWHEW